MVTRRDFLRRAVTLGGAVATAPMINRGHFQLFGRSRSDYSRRTIDLVRESVVIDMLGLVTLDWDRLDRWQHEPMAFKNTDFEKLRNSGITAFHPAVDISTPDPFDAMRDWMRGWNVFLDSYPKQLARIERASDFARVKQERKIGIILGVQNATHFRTLEDVQFFYDRGQRVSQLTYNSENPLGNGCGVSRDTGLTAYGAAVVAKMNELGMAVDISHSGDSTSRDAIEISKKPILITHSNCRALNPRQPRCKPDDIIRKVAARGGVMGITAIRSFVCSQDPTTIEDVLDHFDHVARTAGIDHLGIGSDNDLDGRDSQGYRNMDIRGLDCPERVFALTQGLVHRGYSDKHIRQILGGNFERALREIWAA